MMRWSVRAVGSALLLLASGCNQSAGEVGNSKEGASSASDVDRGRYLASIMDCAGCHNKGSFSPQPDDGHLQGGTVGFEIPGLGVFYPPNLTPHPETGLGRWSEAEIVAAVTKGKRPDGRELSPAMPWRAYSALTDEDARALAAYLKSLPPAANAVPGPSTRENAPRPYLTVAPPVQKQRR